MDKTASTSKLNIDFQQLLSEVNTIVESYERVADATGENFNIFSILRMESKEEQTHSRFIAELLNPKGRHAMGGEFLKLFFQVIFDENSNEGAEEWSNLIDADVCDKAEVFTEYYCGKVDAKAKTGGKIDILIRLNGDCVMIENKVYADEQQYQLERYHNFSKNGKLLFLTLNGDESKYHKSFRKYTPISYSSTICRWLELCVQVSSTKPILRESIVQYLNLVKKLTHQNTNKAMAQNICQKILETENNRNAFISIVRAQGEVRKHFLEKKVIPRIEKVSKILNDLRRNSGDLELKLKLNISSFLEHDSSWKSFSIKSDCLPEGMKITFELGVSKGFRNFLFGLSLEESGFYWKNPEKVKLYKDELALNGFDISKNKWWIARNKFDKYENWENWETLFSLDSDEFERDLQEKIQLLLDVSETVFGKGKK